MLIEFAFENFKSYKHQATLRMEATSVEEHSDSLHQGSAQRTCLPVAAIYGPNGGGKSNVLQAFDCLRDFVVRPHFLLTYAGSSTDLPKFSCRPYAFDAESSREPTTFFVLFQRGGYVYRYILALKGDQVVEEYLHRKKPGRGAPFILFEREGADIRLGPSLNRRGINPNVNPQMPLLAFLRINYDFDPINEAFNWFASCAILDYSQDILEGTLLIPKDQKHRDMVIGMLRSLDIDITEIRYKEDDDGNVESVYLSHGAHQGRELAFEEESKGTQKLLSMALRIIYALERGHLVLSDELDAKMHPKILRYLIGLFTDKKINKQGAQLIFTSHDTSTMSSAVFRRDEIWFAAKDESGSSQLYCLADIEDSEGKRVRPQNAYDRQYLSGRYGADPYLQSMLGWDADEQ